MAVHVEGLNDTVRAMERAGVEVDELKDTMGTIAAEAANVMQGFIPKRSGTLAASARGNRAKGRAIVTVGSARIPYAKPIQWGYPKRHIKPARYVERTDAVMDARTPELLEAGWADIATRNGLT